MRKQRSLFRFFIACMLMGTYTHLCKGQEIDLRPVASKYAIINATLIPAPGEVLQNGTILVEGGLIKSVGSDLKIPADAWVIDADSMYVYAGFISGLSHIGVEKPEETQPEDDKKLTGNPSYKRAGITPNTSVRSMLQSSERSISDFRKLGFTAAHSVPHDGMIAGKGAILLLAGSTGEEMLIADETSMFAQFAGAGGVYPNTVIGVMAKYRDLYRKASQGLSYLKIYSANSAGRQRPESDATIEGLYPVVAKELPVMYKAEDIKDVMRALTLHKELDFNMILGEVQQGWDAIPSIKAAKVPVFLSLDLPEWKEEAKDEDNETTESSEDESEKTQKEVEQEALEKRQLNLIEKYYNQAKLFNEASIPFGFSTLEVKAKDFKGTLLKMVELGLSEEQALAALTTQPAEILGLSDKMGTIEAGKMANFFIADTSYFTEDAAIKYVFVDGKKYEYESKKKKGKSDTEAAEIDASGAWSYTTDTPQGEGSGLISIKGADGDYSGTITVSYNKSTNVIENLEVNGSTISFSFQLNMGEQITVEVSMEVDGDTFEGTLSVAQFGSFPMEGSRTP